jgi:hypothetical protein
MLSRHIGQSSRKITNMGLNKRELAVIAETNRGNYEVEIKSVEKGLWQVSIKIVPSEKHFDVFTSRGELKTWRNLADAITFVQEICSDCKKVAIAVNDWNFILSPAAPVSVRIKEAF